MSAKATRRGVFAGVAAFTALVSAASAKGVETHSDLRAVEKRRDALERFINDESAPGDECEAEMAEWHRLNNMIANAPLTSRSDAAVKLRTVAQVFTRGERSDGRDEVVLAEVIAWLEAH